MNSERQQLLDLFFESVAKYEASAAARRNGAGRLRRILQNLRLFGLSYLWYHAARLRLFFSFARLRVSLFFGKRMLLPAADVGSSVFAMYGIMPHKSERRLTLWFLKNLREDDVFYDIGAHMGYYTALAETLLTKGEAHAFEANAVLCGCFQENFRGAANVHITCAAVSEKEGTVDFYDATQTEDSSASSRFPVMREKIEPARVSAVTLDRYVAEGHRLPTIMKLDIEGGEYDALLGASGIISGKSPIIVMEVWGGGKGRQYSEKAARELMSLGYAAHRIRNDGTLGEICPDPVVAAGTSDDARDNFIFIKQ